MRRMVLAGLTGLLLLAGGCRGASDPNEGLASPASTPLTRKSSPKKTATNQGNPLPPVIQRAPKVPDLLDLQDAKERADKRAELPLPKAEDLPSGSRPFEGTKAVRQQFLRPPPSETPAEALRLAEAALTFDPDESDPVSGIRVRWITQELWRMEAFHTLDAVADTLREKRLLAQNGTWILGQFYKDLTSEMNLQLEESVSRCERWLEASPDSLAARYCLATLYTDWAWQARGSGWASSVSEEGWKIFRERLHKAQEILKTVEDQNRDPYLHKLGITIGMGLGWSPKVVRGYLDKSLAIEPYYSVAAYRAYDYYLFPRWHGTTEERSRFIEEAVDRTEAVWGQGLYAILTEEPDELKVDQARRLKGYGDLLAANPTSFYYFSEYAELTLALQGPKAAQELYKKVLSGELRLPLGEGDKLRLRHRLAREFEEFSSPRATPSSPQEQASMLGVSLGMTREAVESLLGPPRQTNSSGPNQTELHYRKLGTSYSLQIENESQKVVSMAGASAEVKKTTVRRGMNYSELKQAIGSPTEVRKSPIPHPKRFLLLYEPLALVIIWEASTEKVSIFRLIEDPRDDLKSAPPVTSKEWENTWKLGASGRALKAETPAGIVLEFPPGWEQSPAGHPDRPYFVKETNALQVEVVPELSTEDQQSTEEGLVKLASGFLYRTDLSTLLSTESGKCDFGLYGAAIYESPKFEHFQIWYLSDGRNLLKATYTYSEGLAPKELAEVNRVIKTVYLKKP